MLPLLARLRGMYKDREMAARFSFLGNVQSDFRPKCEQNV
jgi:hypothetical protein